MRYDLFSIGTAVVDYFAHVGEEFIRKNKLEKNATNFLPREKVEKFHSSLRSQIKLKAPGDNGRNACEGIVKLGGKSAYASNIGEDEEGAYFKRKLKEIGIADYLVKKRGNTGKILVLITPDKQRTFIANLGNTLDFKMEERHFSAISDSEFLYITSITACGEHESAKSAGEAMRYAREMGKKVGFSLESPPLIKKYRKECYRIIREYSTIVFGNESELLALTRYEDVNDALDEMNEICEIAVAKLGAKGSIIQRNGERYYVRAEEVKVADTTGAGDYYAAGLLFGLAKGYSLWSSGKLGAKLAGRAIERTGASLR